MSSLTVFPPLAAPFIPPGVASSHSCLLCVCTHCSSLCKRWVYTTEHDYIPDAQTVEQKQNYIQELKICLVMQVLLSMLQERRERKRMDVEEAAVAAAAAAAAQSSKHDPAKGQWDFAQRAQRAAQAEEAAAAASGSRNNKKSQHQRHGSASDKEGPTSRLGAEVCTHINIHMHDHLLRPMQFVLGSMILVTRECHVVERKGYTLKRDSESKDPAFSCVQ